MNRKNKSCILFLHSTILFNCFLAMALRAHAQDSSVESRLHDIYQKHYQRPILDSDWFSMISGIQEQSYTVLKGDTLWGISEIYFGDGNYWSKLWSVNKGITNPHLIMVGDTIRFSTGDFKSAPSISVSKGEIESNGAYSIRKDEDSVRTNNYYGTPPDFFVESPRLNLGEESKIEVIPRPSMEYKSDFYLTQEILAVEPKPVAIVESIGSDRMVSGEANRVILKTKEEQTLQEGAVVSIVNEDFEELDRGYGIHVLSIVKVLKMISPQVYEAETLKQFDAIHRGAAILAYVPLYVNMRADGELQQKQVKILSSDKQVWSTGDIIFLKASNSDVQVGDLLKVYNQFDRRIDYYTQNGVLKVVSTSPPYATAVVVHSKTAIDQLSISTPTKSDNSSWFW